MWKIFREEMEVRFQVESGENGRTKRADVPDVRADLLASGRIERLGVFLQALPRENWMALYASLPSRNQNESEWLGWNGMV